MPGRREEPAAPVTVRLVGRFAVCAGGQVLDSGVVAAARSRRILAALALAGSAGLPAQTLARRVWPEPPATWPNALRGAIATLRHAVATVSPEPLVVTTASGWALAPGVRTDLDDARDALARDADPDPAPALRVFLTGSVLPDDDDEWLTDLRAEHRRLRARVLEASGEAALAAGRPDAAIEAALALLDSDPLDEAAHRLHMRARLAAGDLAGAIEAFERCRSALAEELGVDPSPATAALHLDVLRSGAAGGGTMPPLPPGGFFGRGQELATLTSILRGPAVVELIGRGGIGKSRLALQAAHEAVEKVPGRFWAPLGDLTAGALVATTVAAALGVETSGDPTGRLIDRLGTAGPVLLVLDGCEAVADEVADLAIALVEALPGLRLVLTSRVPVGIAGSTRIDVHPLAPEEDPIADAAVQLLADRVALRGAHLRLDSTTVPHLRVLCARCDGVPLALELAAGQLAAMAVGDLLDALGPASARAGDVLRALLEQSVAALDVDGAAVFERLTVVDGRVPLAIVRSMVGGAVAGGRVARLLGELDGAALVLVDRAGARWRYGVDDELRRLARASADDASVADGLAGLAAALEEIAPADPREPPAPYREAIDDAADGFRTLFAAAARGDFARERALALAFRLHRYWTLTRLVEGRYWLDRLLDGAATGTTASLARFAAGYLGYWAGDGAALPLLRRAAVELEADDTASAARAAMFAAGLADDIDDGQGARDDIVLAARLAERTGIASLVMNTTVGAAAIVAERGDPAAIGFLDRALALQADADADQVQAALANAARIAWHVGDADAARRFAAGAMPLLDGPPRIAQVQLACALAGLAMTAGRLEEATGLATAALDAATTLQLDREIPLTNALAARIAGAAGRVDDARRLTHACLVAAQRSEGTWQTALALETAVAVGTVEGAPRGALLATAAGIRAASDRPAPFGLRLDEVGTMPLPREEALTVALAHCVV